MMTHASEAEEDLDILARESVISAGCSLLVGTLLGHHFLMKA